jgi:hypothetical protein
LASSITALKSQAKGLPPGVTRQGLISAVCMPVEMKRSQKEIMLRESALISFWGQPRRARMSPAW